MGSRDEKENIISYLLNNGGDDALSLTTVKEIKATLAGHIERLPEKGAVLSSPCTTVTK